MSYVTSLLIAACAHVGICAAPPSLPVVVKSATYLAGEKVPANIRALAHCRVDGDWSFHVKAAVTWYSDGVVDITNAPDWRDELHLSPEAVLYIKNAVGCSIDVSILRAHWVGKKPTAFVNGGEVKVK